MIGFNLDPIRFDFIWRFNWSKVDHSRPAVALPALNSQRSWRQYLAKSERNSSAELEVACGEATIYPFCAVVYGFRAKSGDPNLSSEAIPLGSYDAKC